MKPPSAFTFLLASKYFLPFMLSLTLLLVGGIGLLGYITYTPPADVAFKSALWIWSWVAIMVIGGYVLRWAWKRADCLRRGEPPQTGMFMKWIRYGRYGVPRSFQGGCAVVRNGHYLFVASHSVVEAVLHSFGLEPESPAWREAFAGQPVKASGLARFIWKGKRYALMRKRQSEFYSFPVEKVDKIFTHDEATAFLKDCGIFPNTHNYHYVLDGGCTVTIKAPQTKLLSHPAVQIDEFRILRSEYAVVREDRIGPMLTRGDAMIVLEIIGIDLNSDECANALSGAPINVGDSEFRFIPAAEPEKHKRRQMAVLFIGWLSLMAVSVLAVRMLSAG